jgi:hypothetical protein
MQDHKDILVIGDFTQNLQFFHFNIQRIVIIDEKNFKLFGQEQGSFLQNKIDGFKYQVTNFALISGNHAD